MKKIMTSIAALFATVLIVVNASAYDKALTFERIGLDAGETISIGEIVCVKDADGEAYKADADDSALRPPVGIAGTAGTDGNAMEIVTRGVLSGWTGLSEGGYVYLSTTAGEATQSAPGSGNNYVVGIAISTTQILFDFEVVQASSATFSNPVSGASPLEFEGASADAYETTITVTDPTADNTVTIPDGSGTIDICENIVKSSTATLTAAEVKNTVINNYGQSAESTLTLPTAAEGMHFVYILGTAAETSHIKADTSDKIVLDGTALDDADKVSNNAGSSVIGESLECWSFQTGASAYDWTCTSNGTWTDGGA